MNRAGVEDGLRRLLATQHDEEVADHGSFALLVQMHDALVRQLLEGVQRWANDDLRSLNAQIEYLLRESLRRAGRASRVPPSNEDSTERDPSTDT